MKYLSLNQNSISTLGTCTCKGTTCNDDQCGTNECFMNRADVCPKFCWAQLCNSAKVEPFSVIV